MNRLPTNQQVDNLLDGLETIYHIETTEKLLKQNFGISGPLAREHISRYRLDKAVDRMMTKELGI